jgi:hypothetical protein
VVRLSLVDPSGCYHSFRIDGSADGLAVRADWDGCTLEMTQLLYDLGRLAEAVDDAFAEAGLCPDPLRSTLSGPIPNVVLTLARACDLVDRAEYSYKGQRRAIVAY